MMEDDGPESLLEVGGWAAAGKVSGHEKFYEVRTGQIGQALGKGMVLRMAGLC